MWIIDENILIKQQPREPATKEAPITQSVPTNTTIKIKIPVGTVLKTLMPNEELNDLYGALDNVVQVGGDSSGITLGFSAAAFSIVLLIVAGMLIKEIVKRIRVIKPSAPPPPSFYGSESTCRYHHEFRQKHFHQLSFSSLTNSDAQTEILKPKPYCSDTPPRPKGLFV